MWADECLIVKEIKDKLLYDFGHKRLGESVGLRLQVAVYIYIFKRP